MPLHGIPHHIIDKSALRQGLPLAPLPDEETRSTCAERLPSSDASAREPIQVGSAAVRTPGYAAIVSLYGEHDLATTPAIKVALAPLDGDLLIDLTDCDFIDSSVIGALLEKREDLQREGHKLELVVPAENPIVRRIVTVIGLDTMIRVHDSLPASKRPESPAKLRPTREAHAHSRGSV